MSEWKEYRFDEFVNVNPKVVFSEKEKIPFVEMKDVDAGNKFCTNSAFRKLSGGSRFENGDTLFARITPCLENGKIAQVRNLSGGKGLGSTEFHVLRGRSGISISDFVYYLSRWNDVRDFAELNLHGTSGRQRFPSEAFKELVLNLPGISEQQSIAFVLSSLDDKIDLLHRQNKTLEQMAETLFRQWFVEEAKDEWENLTLSDLAQFYNGKSRPKEDGSIPVYGGNGILGYTNMFNYDGRSIIVGRVGAYCGSLYLENKPIWVSDNAILIKSVNDYEFYYLFFLLRTLNLNSLAEGSSHPLLTQGLLKSIEITKPHKERLEIFENIISSKIEKIDFNKNQIVKLEVLRDLLLPKLMNGTVRVINN